MLSLNNLDSYGMTNRVGFLRNDKPCIMQTNHPVCHAVSVSHITSNSNGILDYYGMTNCVWKSNI